MTVSPPNLDFIAGFQHGSYESVKELYELFYTDLYILAENATGQTPGAHSIVLETFIKLYRMRAQFNSLVNIKAFLYITVRGTCRRYNTTAHPTAPESTPWYTADGSLFNDEAVRSRAISRLCNEVEQLPDKCRRVFQLAFCRQMPVAEAAEQLDLDQPAILRLRANAIQQLRDNLYKKQLFSVPLFVYFLAVACAENC